MATLTRNPKTSDASLRKSSTTFAGAHDGSTASSVIQASSGTLTTQVDRASDLVNYGVDRIVLPIDVSALGSGATVTAGTLAINVSATLSPWGTTYLDLIAISLADVNSIAVGDWASCVANYGTQCASRISFSSTGVKTFTLNAAGIAAIQANRTGTVVFAVIMGNDQANSVTSPDNLNGSPFYTYVLIDSSTGTTPPVLTVTYTDSTITASGSDTATATDSSAGITAARGTTPQDTATGTDASSAPSVSDPAVTASQTGTATDSSSSPAVTSYKTAADTATAWDIPASGGEASGPGPFLFWPGPWSEVQVVLTGTPITSTESGAATEGALRVVRIGKSASDTATGVDSSGNTGGPVIRYFRPFYAPLDEAISVVVELDVAPVTVTLDMEAEAT